MGTHGCDDAGAGFAAAQVVAAYDDFRREPRKAAERFLLRLHDVDLETFGPEQQASGGANSSG